jgi:hypothetical protein
VTIASAGHRGLVLVPTRELAIQVHRSRGMTPQRDALRRGVDIVVATPGRLIDRRLLPAPLEEVVGRADECVGLAARGMTNQVPEHNDAEGNT